MGDPEPICSGKDPTQCDLTNHTDIATFLRYTDSERILIVIIIPIILGIGVCANMTFIFVVLRLRHMHTITNYYLLNLAISDVSFLSLAAGDKLALYFVSPMVDDQRVLGPWGCTLLYYTTNICFFASMFLITAVMAEKFYAVCKPLHHRVASGIKRTVRTLVTVWIVALLFAFLLIPSHAVYNDYQFIWPDEDVYSVFPLDVGKCEPVRSMAANYIANGIQTIPFFTVMVVNFYMNVRIVRALTKRMRAHPGSIAANERLHGIINARNQRTRNQVVRMLVINGVVFFCLLSPFQIFSFYRMIEGLVTDTTSNIATRTRQLVWAFRILSYINPAVNPFIYTLSNKRYRRAFFLAIPCLKRLCLQHRNPDRAALAGTVHVSLEESKNKNLESHSENSTRSS
nr:neuropeptides capa receptor-like [Lytechinus pictus]